MGGTGAEFPWTVGSLGQKPGRAGELPRFTSGPWSAILESAAIFPRHGSIRVAFAKKCPRKNAAGKDR